MKRILIHIAPSINFIERLKSLEARSVFIALIILLPCFLISATLKDQKLFYHVYLFCSGIFLWTYFEYHSHRFWMHHKKFKQPLEGFTKHIYHHSHPRQINITRKMRVVAVGLEAAFIATAFFLDNYFTVFCGFFFGLILYFFMHYFIHQPKAFKVIPGLVKSHLIHHGKYANRCFGIITTFWDKMNNTASPKDTVISPKTLEWFYRKT
jgi:hypothetical protein